jgi:hypothetical protein
MSKCACFCADSHVGLTDANEQDETFAARTDVGYAKYIQNRKSAMCIRKTRTFNDSPRHEAAHEQWIAGSSQFVRVTHFA